MKYKTRLRSRISNLKDQKNPELRRNVLCGSIAPERIASMTAEVSPADCRRWWVQCQLVTVGDGCCCGCDSRRWRAQSWSRSERLWPKSPSENTSCLRSAEPRQTCSSAASVTARTARTRRYGTRVRPGGTPGCVLLSSVGPVCFQVQTRSADEPMTTFVLCNGCGNRWKVSWVFSRGSFQHPLRAVWCFYHKVAAETELTFLPLHSPSCFSLSSFSSCPLFLFSPQTFSIVSPHCPSFLLLLQFHRLVLLPPAYVSDLFTFPFAPPQSLHLSLHISPSFLFQSFIPPLFSCWLWVEVSWLISLTDPPVEMIKKPIFRNWNNPPAGC